MMHEDPRLDSQKLNSGSAGVTVAQVWHKWLNKLEQVWQTKAEVTRSIYFNPNLIAL